MKVEWEDIFEKNNHGVSFSTCRTEVIGGWLICHSIKVYNQFATSTCFIPDPNHEWLIDNECGHIFTPIDVTYNSIDQTYKSKCVYCGFEPE